MRFFHGGDEADFEAESYAGWRGASRHSIPPQVSQEDTLDAEPWGVPLTEAEPAARHATGGAVKSLLTRFVVLMIMLVVAFGAGWTGATWLIYRTHRDVRDIVMTEHPAGTAQNHPSKKAYLGIRGKDFRQGGVQGVEIVEVFPNSPAARAGLHADWAPVLGASPISETPGGYIVVGANDRPIHSEADLDRLLSNSIPGTMVKLLMSTSDGHAYAVIPVTLGGVPPNVPGRAIVAGQQGVDPFSLAAEAERRLEAELFDAVNRARARRGLPPLRYKLELQHVARRHSEDMAARQFFGHINPDGANVVDRLRAAGVEEFTAVGENIFRGRDTPGKALAQLINLAVRAWLRSPSHRQNVFNPYYTMGGVGIARGQGSKIYITQVYLQS